MTNDIQGPPSNVDAERAMLGSILIDKRVLADVLQIAQPADCYDPKNRIVFEHLVMLHNKREPIDYVTLVNILTESGKLEQIGGASELASLSRAVPSAYNVTHYAEIVANTATRRRLLDVAADISRIAYKESDADAAMSESETALYRVRGNRSNTLMHVSEPAQELSREFEQIAAGTMPVALSTGYPVLDRILTGFRRQELTIVAARTSIGKTALLCNIATKIAQAGKGVALFSA